MKMLYYIFGCNKRNFLFRQVEWISLSYYLWAAFDMFWSGLDFYKTKQGSILFHAPAAAFTIVLFCNLIYYSIKYYRLENR